MKQYFAVYCAIMLTLMLMFSCNSNGQGQIATAYGNTDTVISVSKKSVAAYQKNAKGLNVYGKVKSITCINYKQYIPNSELKYYVTKEDFKFDRKGNIVEETCYLEDEIFSYRQVYSYDNKGNWLKMVSYLDNGQPEFSQDIVLNEQGLFVSEKYWDNDRDNVTTYSYQTINDTVIAYTIVRKEKIRTQGEKTDSSYAVREKYKNGNLVKEVNLSSGETWSVSEYEYDDHNNLISDTKRTGSLYEKRFAYDTNNRQIYSYDYNTVNHEKTVVQREFDAAGNIVKEVTYINDKISELDSHTAVYVYDSHNNWIKRTRFRLNGRKISVLERKIVYY